MIATPIGNLRDITLRALDILKDADFLIVEDKRRTAIVLNEYDLGKKKMESISERIPQRKLKRIISEIKRSRISALVSDAGTPIISDPGRAIVDMCWTEGIEIDIAPGPSAVVSAIAVSGFPGSRFTFLGFLPRGKKRRRVLREMASRKETLVFFESPNRLIETLEDIKEILGNREIFIARELTKIHQELFRGKVSDAIEHFNGEVLGEITVVVSGKED